MSLHRLAQITMGVPNVAETISYYRDFGLHHEGDGLFSTVVGGEQLRIVASARRRLVAMVVGCDDLDDVAAITRSLTTEGFLTASTGAGVVSVEPVTDTQVSVEVMPRLVQTPVLAPSYNGPGRYDRVGKRAPGILREGPVQPKKLGHAVVGCTDMAATRRFFTDGLGFKVSDAVGQQGVFLRCSVDHHNIMLLQMPVNFLHHTSWQVDDVDEIGRGAKAMLDGNPERHVWGLGRHHAGSNFFWYLKDPAGNFSEYYSDMDCIPDDEIWTPEVLDGAKGLFSWGPPPPPSFLAPEDLADLMVGTHS
ncbi:dioxygenase [Mycolicibacterium canariasense]|uniref:Dioxygenase n=1 Tax=Mycolicibacterium canariasense TaxID=228230 RepID=A0A100WGT7_MYCCR|nr:VOC family protein [Mycolicibacterium canariasense]MCV7211803.1 VOC family protein [Mycolicibacterium canariasense]ORV08132.1 dioxygenase [Mycolicibacterium canariasense]GAS98332.1 dioxygenase [Mycolicibacterium canariasense]